MALNLFVAMVGTTGRGKGLADSVASQYVEVLYGGQPCVVLDRPVGSGEGVVGEFLRNDDDDGPLKPIIFTALEVDTVAALFARTGNTLSAELRKMFMGEQLGQTNASKHPTGCCAASTGPGWWWAFNPNSQRHAERRRRRLPWTVRLVARGRPNRPGRSRARDNPPKLRSMSRTFIRVAYLSVPKTSGRWTDDSTG